jgi:hypothetical protein
MGDTHRCPCHANPIEALPMATAATRFIYRQCTAKLAIDRNVVKCQGSIGRTMPNCLPDSWVDLMLTVTSPSDLGAS